MVTNTCRYTGFSFEAESRRSKNHPLVSAFLNEANAEGKYKVGAYAKGVELINAAKGQFDTIEELIAFVREGFEAWKQDADSIRRWTQGDRIRQLKAQSRQREAINNILRQNNYRWELEGYKDEEDADHFAGFASAPIGQSWQLYSSDNRKVSIAQAFQEIGQEIPQ